MSAAQEIKDQMKKLSDLLEELEDMGAENDEQALKNINIQINYIYSKHKDLPPLDNPPPIPNEIKKIKPVVEDNVFCADKIFRLINLLSKKMEAVQKEEARSSLKKKSGILSRMSNFLYAPTKKKIMYVESISSLTENDIKKMKKDKISRVVIKINKNNAAEVDQHNLLIKNGMKVLCLESSEKLSKYLKANKNKIKLFETESAPKHKV